MSKRDHDERTASRKEGVFGLSLLSSISSLPGFSVWASLDPSHWNSGWWMISWTTRKRTIKERSSEPWEESFSVEKSIRNKKELNYCEKHVEKKMLLHDKWSRGSFPSSTTTSPLLSSCWKGQFIQVEKAFQQHHCGWASEASETTLYFCRIHPLVTIS